MASGRDMVTSKDAVQREIEELEARLARLRASQQNKAATDAEFRQALTQRPPAPSPSSSSTHFLLLLADSALPVGSGRRAAGASASRRGSAAAVAADDDDDVPPLVSAHLAPLFGVVCALVGLSLRQAAYVFMLSHVKALISAAVRASMFGPYQAQKVLASDQVQRLIDAVVDREWDTPVEDAGQSVPVMDLWVGRHELLYSRIFNS
ncbi:hypothetical protein HIM_08739 [Hirsutella minnesotensis 3608]|uniref:Urease accessory protein UreF n=1 Tax=Hirsutella minnesotensis 3608 TaxID=1043627 RepID=A0A0F8A3I6_9HYPO|nr:hypothetical protein HIM_08739 [Hirsutella minnesotensis 3608]